MANTNVLQITPDELRDYGNYIKEQTLKIAQQDPNITPETDLEGFQNQGGYAPEPGTRTPGSITPRQKGKNVRQGDAAQRRNEAARGGEQLTPEEIWPNYPNMLQIEGGMPPEISPDAWDPRQERRKQRIRDLKQGNQNPNEKKAAEGKQSPRERIDIPDFLPNVDVRPQDLLKILQLIPALAGFDLQMADARGDAILQSLPRTKSGSHREALKSGELTQDKLIESLKIAAPLLLEEA